MTRPGAEAQPTQPFESNRFYFGKPLTVDDLVAEQAYARGKAWLHAAFLHGWGVVSGLRVDAGPARGEITVGPGLAVDELGRELPLSDAVRLDVAGWAPAHAGERAVTDDGPALVAHVVLRHEAVPERPVPALTDGGGPGTEFSRVVERGRPCLVAGPAPAAGPPRYPRLAQLLGSAPATDRLAIRALEEIDAAGPGEQPAVRRDWFQRLAAEDTMDLDPGAAVAGVVPTAVPLAELRIPLDNDGGAAPGHIAIDNWIRRPLLRGAELGALLTP